MNFCIDEQRKRRRIYGNDPPSKELQVMPECIHDPLVKPLDESESLFVQIVIDYHGNVANWARVQSPSLSYHKALRIYKKGMRKLKRRLDSSEVSEVVRAATCGD